MLRTLCESRSATKRTAPSSSPSWVAIGLLTSRPSGSTLVSIANRVLRIRSRTFFCCSSSGVVGVVGVMTLLYRRVRRSCLGTTISARCPPAGNLGHVVRLDPASRVGVEPVDTPVSSTAHAWVSTGARLLLLPRRRRGRLSPKEVETHLRAYEVMVILDPDLEERTVGPSLDTYLNVVRNDGGSIENVDVWGRRRLSYEIDKNAEGIYAVVTLNAEPATV